MAYQPKSYRKFLAGSVSAALVATAVGPVVANAASFSDVDPNSTHGPNILALADKGYIKGFQDGTFKPFEKISRGQAAKIFARILTDQGFKAPDKIEQVFDDVPLDAKDQELVKAAAIVKAAGVMTGSEGKLNPASNITRQQMAKVIVETFDLEKPADFKSQITDLDKADAWAREYIQTLEANGVTVVKEYRPKDNVTRGEFATFIKRAMDATATVTADDITAVKFVDENTLEVTFNGELKDVKKEDFSIEGVEIDSVSIKAAAAAESKTTVVVIKTKTKLEEGKTYTVAYKGKTTDKTKVEVPVVTPKVESVSAIDGTSIEGNKSVPTNVKFKIKFSAPLDKASVSAANFKLYQGGTLVAVNVPTLDDDGKTVTLVPSGLLLDNKDYKLVISKDVKTTDGKTLGADKEVVFTTSNAAVVSSVGAYNGNTPVDSNVQLDEAVASANVNKLNITFNKDLDFTSVNKDTVKVFNVTDNEYVPVDTVTYANKVVTFNVASTYNSGQLKQNKTYRIEIKGVKGLDGVAAADYSQTFNVVKPFAVTPKLADGTTLASATGVNGKLTNDYNADGTLNKPAFKIIAVFDTPIKKETLTSDNVKLYDRAEQKYVDGTISYDEASQTLVFVPKADLKDNAQYTFTLTKDVKDVYGQSLANTTDYSFTTGDFTAPTVVDTTPVSGTADVALDSKIVINFSEPMAPASFQNNGSQLNTNTDSSFDANTSIVLLDSTANTVVNASLAWSNNYKTLTITPAAELTKNHTYTLKLAGKNSNGNLSVKDANGKELASDYTLVFNTGAGDLTAPSVTAVTDSSLTGTVLTNGAKAVNTQGKIYIKFSKKMNLNSLTPDDGTGTAGTVKLYDVTNGSYVNLTDTSVFDKQHSADGKYSYISLNFDNITDRNGAATGTPTDLASDTKYRLIISSNVTDASSNANKLPFDYEFEFTTGPAPSLSATQYFVDNDGDNVIDVGETNGTLANANAVPTDAKLAFTFSEAVKNVDSTSIVVKDAAGNVVNGTLKSDVNGDGTADDFVFIPSDGLKGNTVYTISFANAITDNVGNPFATRTITFKTADTTAPKVVSVTPDNGAFDVPVDSTIKVVFDKDMDTASLAAGVVLKQGNNVVATSQSYDAATKTLTITPKNYLAKDTAYTVDIDPTVVKDVKGNFIDSTATSHITKTFVTNSAAKTPGIVSATLNTTTNQLTIVLDKPVTNSSLTAADLVVGNGGDLGTNKSVALSADKKTIVITFQKDSNGNYDYVITPGVTTIDLANTVTFADPVDGSKTVPATSNPVTVK